MEKDTNQLDLPAALSYMLGGKCTLVIHSDTSGQNWRVRIVQKTPSRWYVYDDLHSDINGDPVYLGFIGSYGDAYWFKGVERLPSIRYKDVFDHWVKSQEVMQKLVAWLSSKFYPSQLKLYHTGYCSVCGRPLKDPVSLRLGIGPKCGGRQ